MTKTKPVRHGAKRLAAATMLLSLLGTAGCMTWHRAVTRAANDVEAMIDPTIDPAGQATDECQDRSLSAAASRRVEEGGFCEP